MNLLSVIGDSAKCRHEERAGSGEHDLEELWMFTGHGPAHTYPQVPLKKD